MSPVRKGAVWLSPKYFQQRPFLSPRTMRRNPHDSGFFEPLGAHMSSDGFEVLNDSTKHIGWRRAWKDKSNQPIGWAWGVVGIIWSRDVIPFPSISTLNLFRAIGRLQRFKRRLPYDRGAGGVRAADARPDRHRGAAAGGHTPQPAASSTHTNRHAWPEKHGARSPIRRVAIAP